LGIGDWGLGIGPNPQSPIPKKEIKIKSLFIIYSLYIFEDLKIIRNS
jgi:hypothetical protein